LPAFGHEHHHGILGVRIGVLEEGLPVFRHVQPGKHVHPAFLCLLLDLVPVPAVGRFHRDLEVLEEELDEFGPGTHDIVALFPHDGCVLGMS